MENCNSANTVLHYGKDGALTGSDKEHAETSMRALHLLQSSLVHVNTLLLQQVLAEPAWAKNLSEEDRRGLTALFWSNVNPYGHLPPGPGQAARPLPCPVPAPRRTSPTDRVRGHDEGFADLTGPRMNGAVWPDARPGGRRVEGLSWPDGGRCG